jgi:hypothetical protein
MLCSGLSQIKYGNRICCILWLAVGPPMATLFLG